MSRYFGLHTAAELAVPLFLALPMAHLAARLEYQQRKWQDAGYNALLHWARRAHLETTDSRPERLVARSLAQIVTLNFLLFTLGLLVLLTLYHLLRDWLPPGALNLPLTWRHLWFLAGIGGIVGLRLQKSIALFAASVAAIALVYLL